MAICAVEVVVAVVGAVDSMGVVVVSIVGVTVVVVAVTVFVTVVPVVIMLVIVTIAVFAVAVGVIVVVEYSVTLHPPCIVTVIHSVTRALCGSGSLFPSCLVSIFIPSAVVPHNRQIMKAPTLPPPKPLSNPLPPNPSPRRKIFNRMTIARFRLLKIKIRGREIERKIQDSQS